jgi:AICAR transformylase/IMP cyclohydrolase PurH (only IMP cyclohydrolase domain in Aful)
VASGNTAAALEAIGLPVEHVEALTESPEMLGGRVKTLHPRVHAGILARRDEEDDVATLEEHGIEAFDLVCVNLYPFEAVASQQGVTEAETVEMIDIGGPSMLRGAAKNFAHCAAVCRPGQYHQVLEELRADGELSLETRRRLAAEAFGPHRRLRGRNRDLVQRPRRVPRLARRLGSRRHSTSPTARTRTSAARTTPSGGVRRHLLSRGEQLHGPELSFNNLFDLNGALRSHGSSRSRRA